MRELIVITLPQAQKVGIFTGKQLERIMGHAEAATKFNLDAERTGWHDKALWFVRAKRDKAAASIPEWEQLRTLAEGIKAETLNRLPELLEQFEAACTRNGVKVHFAVDAKEHNAIVLGLLQKAGAKKVVKSKSMLTEECGLNPVLYKNNIEVVDTDLGERIVQLRHEPPSHIVLPAIHTKREEIAELFAKELGTDPANADPTYLTRAARGDIRKRFLEADAGITGVNFAIAETGGIVICTNEGNADLGTSLPKLHIACMGLEKFLPKLEDLGVFTRLLARSATGQNITTYTSLFHKPRPGAEMHIVIVDNGRSAMMGREEYRKSLGCIRCGACMNTCPVYRRSGGHSYGSVIPGPIGSVLSPGMDPAAHSSLPFASTLCGSCTDVCPVKINLHEQLLAWRGDLAKAGHVHIAKRLALKAASKVLSNTTLYRIAAKALRLTPGVLMRNKTLNPWERSRDLPPVPPKTFRQLWKERKPQS